MTTEDRIKSDPRVRALIHADDGWAAFMAPGWKPAAIFHRKLRVLAAKILKETQPTDPLPNLIGWIAQDPSRKGTRHWEGRIKEQVRQFAKFNPDASGQRSRWVDPTRLANYQPPRP